MKFTIFLFFSLWAKAELDTPKIDGFFNWLNQSESKFSNCKIELKNNFYILCDNTKVPKDVLVKLAQKKPAEVEKFLNEKNIKIIKICNSSSKDCIPADSKTQKSMTHLHGLFNAAENSITYKEGSSTGVLIHEYIHYLQTRNENPINSKVYKKTRNEIQKQISSELDYLELKIVQAQKSKNNVEMMKLTQVFIKINNYMIEFGKWQDLIDERSIFLLFKNHGVDIGFAQADIDFAIKKLNALCDNPKLKSSLPECKL